MRGRLSAYHHLQSPKHGAARIRSINEKPALDHPGVVAVFTGKDVKDVGPVPCGASLPGLRVPPHSILAKDRVYFVGHPVAVVVATDRYIAADAAERVAAIKEEAEAQKGVRGTARRVRKALTGKQTPPKKGKK